MSGPEEVRRGYQERWQRHDGARASAASRSQRLSNLRAATFLAVVAVLIGYDFLEGSGETAMLALGGLLLAGFVGQVVVHRRVRRTEAWEGALAAVAREGLLRADRRWDELDEALPPAERLFPAVEPDHPYARDLDLTGRVSLLRLLGPVTSERGRTLLTDWLLAPGTLDSVRRRQPAVRELAPHAELRAAFAAHGRLDAREALDGLDGFLEWAEDSPVFLDRPLVRWAAWILPAILLVSVLADVLWGAGPWWLLPALAQVVLVRSTSRPAGRSLGRAEAGATPARALVPQLRLLEGTEWETPELAEVRERLGRGGEAAHARLHQLLRRLDTVQSRRNMFYGVLAPVLMLEVHLAVALDRWRAEHGRALRGWVEAAGTWEALSSLATLAHDHPGWTFPELVEPGPALLSGEALGHPLLHPDECVPNDVEVGPPGRVLLVTGSNMSGKSTLLRALGLNAVLAGAGGPVCAASLRLPVVRVHTSMRVDDSLARGVSLFMAELLRIRSVVEAARTQDPEGRPVLYLLDEMLHGTNTAERRVAARGVVRHLLEAGAIGAVSTHDLTLAETPGLEEAAVPVHFREEVHREGGTGGRPRITFDYVLRPGIATTRNALKLLEAVGLGALAASDGPGDGAPEVPVVEAVEPEERSGS